MKTKTNICKLLFSIIVIFFYSCETINLDQTEDPSGVPDALLEPVFAFNYIQLQLPDFVDSSNDFTQRVTRQMAMTGGNTYDNAFAAVNSNNNWSIAFNILNAVKLMEPKAIEKQEFYALGASKVMRAYIMMTLVDIYGDIPYTEALQGNKNLTPKYDSSAFVYAQILVELDKAIEVLNQTNFADSKINDLYYNNKSSWITLAKTLKFKLYNNARLAGSDIGISDIGSKMNDIILGGDYIDLKSEDFAFRYGTSRFSPNTRHPLYNDQYERGGGAYIANYFMWSMTVEKSPTPVTTANPTIIDPRTAYYFYKQDASTDDETDVSLPNKLKPRPDHYNEPKYRSFYFPSTLTPFTISNWIISKPGNGFWGRDHGDNNGIPADATKRTVAGIYPVGGKYGSSPSSVQNDGKDGALGAGIMPILLSSYVNFMIAEASLTVPNFIDSARASAQFQAGISASINKTVTLIPNYPTLTTAEQTNLPVNITKYLNFLNSRYASASQAGKLELIIKEFYLASWGNGIEPYNNYRRTGYPSNFQPTVEAISGSYYYTAYYAGNAVNNNPNAPSNVRTRKVFWDKANLILH